MKIIPWLALAVALAGCGGQAGHQHKADSKDEETTVRESLAALSPEDRKLAEAQQFCAVQDTKPLGWMGTPVKVMVKDQPVFLCCKGCSKSALADPDKTLAKVAELKAKPPAK